MRSSKAGPDSFEHIVMTAVDLMSMVSERATNDLKAHLPGPDTLGRARTSAGNAQDVSQSVLRLGALAGELLVDAAARLTQDMAIPFLENQAPPGAPVPVGEASSTSRHELSITAAPGRSGSATVCVYNRGKGAARGLLFGATPLCRFGEAGGEIPAKNVTWSLSPQSSRLDGTAWRDATVKVDVPDLAREGEYLGYVRASDEDGSVASEGRLALRVTVVAEHRGGGTILSGSAPSRAASDA